MMYDDIVGNKITSIQRCIEGAREEYALAGGRFREDYSRLDAAILNVTRACEQAIDLANYVIKTRKMGIPTESAESFTLLARKEVISRQLEDKLTKMVSFRNITVHEYQKLDLDVVEEVITTGLDDLAEFSDRVLEYLNKAKRADK